MSKKMMRNPIFKIDSDSLGITLEQTMKELASAGRTFVTNQYDSALSLCK